MNEMIPAVALIASFGGPMAYGFWLMWAHRNDPVMSGKE